MNRNCLNVTVSAWANYRETKNPKKANLWAWLHSDKFAPQVEQIRATADKEERDKIKATLWAITPSGTFSHREEAGILEYSGLIQFDVDGLTQDEARELKAQLCNLEEVAYLGLSVSGRGLWGLIPIAYPEKHRQHFEALAKDFLAWGIVLDKAPANVASLRGYSWDETAYFNPQAKTYTKLATYSTTSQQKGPQATGTEARKVEICLEQIEAGRIDITANYGDWFALGCVFADEFGESGREFFHRISAFYPGYSPREADGQFTACLNRKKKQRYGVGLFFDFCEPYGVTFIEQLKAEEAAEKKRAGRDAKKAPDINVQTTKPSPKSVQNSQEGNAEQQADPYGYPSSWDEPAPGESLLEQFARKNPALGKLVERLGLEVEQ